MGFLSNLFGSLGGLGAVAADLFAILQYLFSLIVYVFQVLVNGIIAIGNFLWSFIVQFGKFFQHLWANFFKGIFTRVMNVLQKAHDWLEARLRPVLDFLKRVRKLYDAIFLKYVKPVLDMLQHVRQFLLILRALHINIGAELDAWVAKVQNQIAGTFLAIRAGLNNVIDLANILADPTLLLRKPTLIASLRRILPALSVVLTRRPLGYWFPSPRKNPSPGQAPVSLPGPGGTAPTFPLASSFLGTDDGLGGFTFPQLGFLSTASAVDDIDALEFFMEELYPPPECVDPAECMLAAIRVSVPSYGG